MSFMLSFDVFLSSLWSGWLFFCSGCLTRLPGTCYFQPRRISVFTEDTRSDQYIHIYTYMSMYQSLGHVPPPPPNGMVPPLPRIIRILGMMLAMLGMLSSTVRALQLRSQTPFHPVNQPPHLSQHPTLNQTTLQTLLNPNPKPKSTQTPNPPETHRKPTRNQP